MRLSVRFFYLHNGLKACVFRCPSKAKASTGDAAGKTSSELLGMIVLVPCVLYCALQLNEPFLGLGKPSGHVCGGQRLRLKLIVFLKGKALFSSRASIFRHAK